MNSGRKLIQDLAIRITEELLSSPPKGDEWADIGVSELGGEFAIRAVPKGGEPHFISVMVRSDRGEVRIRRISCCEHLEGLAERILGEDQARRHRC